jgi:hypothetical protein
MLKSGKKNCTLHHKNKNKCSDNIPFLNHNLKQQYVGYVVLWDI